eukprot:1158608-Pelagomonas_calceolata.AAC.1
MNQLWVCMIGERWGTVSARSEALPPRFLALYRLCFNAGVIAHSKALRPHLAKLLTCNTSYSISVCWHPCSTAGSCTGIHAQAT